MTAERPSFAGRLHALASRQPRLSSYLGFVALAAAGRFASYNALPSHDMGQYMYVGGEVLHGAAPYAEVANNKGPANFALWAVLRAICGDSPAAVRVALVLATGLAALALAQYVGHHAGRAAGLLAGATLAILSSAHGLEAFDPNNAQFGLVAMAAAWGMSTRRDRTGTLLAGGLAALSVLLNPAFGLVVPFVAWEIWSGRGRAERVRGIGLATAGGLAATAPFVLWLAATGALDDMRIQVFGQVARSLEPDRPGGATVAGAPVAQPDSEVPLDFLVSLPSSVLWVAGFAGALVAMRDRRLRPAAIAATLWMALSILRVEAASYAFDNQYVPGLAGIAVGVALGIASLWGPGTGRRVALAALVLAGPVWSAVFAPQLRELSIPADQRGDPFVPAAVEYIRASTEEDSKLTVVGYAPEVQWLADRRAPTRFFDVFGLSSRADYAAERRRDLFADPPVAIAAVGDAVVDSDVEQLIAQKGYTLAYDRVTRIWLRPG